MTRLYTSYLRLYSFQTGRRLYVIQRMLERAKTVGDAGLIERLEAALAHDRETVRIERGWAAKRSKGAPKGKAVVIDRRIDRLLAALFKVVTGKRDELPPEEPEAILADGFVDRYFSDGAVGYTALPFEEEAAEVDWLLGELHEDPERTTPIADVTALGVAAYVRQLVALLPDYLREIGQQEGESVAYGAVRKARAQGLENVARVIARVLGTYDGPEQEESRGLLLEPFDLQTAKVAGHLKGRRRIPDADPNTGEDQVDPASAITEIGATSPGNGGDGAAIPA